MTTKVDLNKIAVGDRIGIRSPDFQDNFEHWGKVISRCTPTSFHVQMDDPELPEAKGYETLVAGAVVDCFYTSGSEIKRHIPASKVAMHVGKPVNVEDHAEPKPLTAHDDIQATLDFLHATTKRKWKATTKDVQLDVGGSTTYAGTMTIAFTEDKQS